MREAEDFAAEYAPIQRKTVKFGAGSNSAAVSEDGSPKREVCFFASDTEEFSSAMRKISPELLRLLKDQFQASPSVLVAGVFEETKEEISEILETEEGFDFSDEEISDD